MKMLEFDRDNNNAFLIMDEKKHDFSHHINSFPFPILHGHLDYWEFTLVTKGSIKNVCNNETFTYTTNTLFYSTTKDIHKLITDEKSDQVQYCNIIVRESRLKEILNCFSPNFYETLLNGKKSFHFSEFRSIELDTIFHMINTLDTSDTQKYEDYICSALFLILQFLYFVNIDNTESENPWINILNKKMNNTEFLKYNVDRLCEELNCSRMHLNRFIKQYYNMTPHQFLLNYKLSYIHNLLLTSDLSIKDILEVTGYDSFSSFSKNFKEKYGCTPYKFKQTHKY